MKVFLTSLTLIIVSAISIFAQNATTQAENCTDQTVEKISSREISIGADLNSVIDLLGLTEERKQNILKDYSSDKNDSFGFNNFGITPNQNSQQQEEKFAGISNYNFNFLDSRLRGFSVSYTKPNWQDNEQFTAKISEIFNLPDVKKWNTYPNGSRWLQCGNYKIATQTFGQSSLSIYDNRIGQILDQRKQKVADEQFQKDLKTFKP